MDGFTRRKNQKKTDILKAALHLFLADGVQKVSIAEIAKNANVSQVTIYNYFESKLNLVHETIRYYVNKSWAEMVQIIDSDIPYLEKVKQLIFNKKETADDIHPEFYDYFMKDYSSGSSYVKNLYETKIIPRLITFFNEGKEKGYIHESISNEAIMTYFNILKEAFQREEVYKNILPFTDEITKLIFYGIVGEGNNNKKKI